MFTKIFLVAAIIAAVSAQDHHHGHEHHHKHEEHKHVDYYAHPKYEYAYEIKDPHTHDMKHQHEHRDGDVVKGEYALHQPDGTVRIVKYHADKKTGFHADVKYEGHAKHIVPEHHHHVLLVAAIIAAVYAQDHHHGHEHHHKHEEHKHVDYYIIFQAHPKYEFAYEIKDPHTHDLKHQHEHRDGDVVKGEYALHQPDGTVRIVKYHADKKTGFHADVKYEGHAKHIVPEHHHHH
ncbi:uncharacterized protein LOC142973277 [Anticarsia gemmatalis]|uniref:uncharacterized protein LOC142973277 n=1 Tax=Anticarsia gemmatalis TaxID=129554 RepID=UPI003F76589D